MELPEQRGQFDSQGGQSDSQDGQSDNVSDNYDCYEGEDVSSPTHCHDDCMAPPARVARRAIPLPDAPSDGAFDAWSNRLTFGQRPMPTRRVDGHPPRHARCALKLRAVVAATAASLCASPFRAG
eukprot:5525742-Pyramimonas_sp.AAC.1